MQIWRAMERVAEHHEVSVEQVRDALCEAMRHGAAAMWGAGAYDASAPSGWLQLTRDGEELDPQAFDRAAIAVVRNQLREGLQALRERREADAIAASDL